MDAVEQYQAVQRQLRDARDTICLLAAQNRISRSTIDHLTAENQGLRDQLKTQAQRPRGGAQAKNLSTQGDVGPAVKHDRTAHGPHEPTPSGPISGKCARGFQQTTTHRSSTMSRFISWLTGAATAVLIVAAAALAPVTAPAAAKTAIALPSGAGPNSIVLPSIRPNSASGAGITGGANRGARIALPSGAGPNSIVLPSPRPNSTPKTEAELIRSA
jgi:hypothetical protein